MPATLGAFQGNAYFVLFTCCMKVTAAGEAHVLPSSPLLCIYLFHVKGKGCNSVLLLQGVDSVYASKHI